MLHNFSCDYSWNTDKALVSMELLLCAVIAANLFVALCFSQLFPSALSASELRA